MKKILSFFAAILFAAGMMADPVVLPATLDVSNVSFRSEGMPDFTLAEGDYAGTYFDMGAHDSANDTLLYAEWDVTIQPIKYNVAVVVYNTNSWRVQLDLLNQSDEVVKAIRYKGSSGQCGQYAIGALDLSDLAAGNYKVRVHAATAWSAMKLRDVIFEADYQGVSVALPGTLTPAYALLSSGASVANNAIAFAPSTAPSEYATWNVSFAEAGEYTVSIDFTAPNGHTYGVALLSADGATQIGAVAEAQSWDTGVKEIGSITVAEAGNYKVKLTNATQWSEAVLNSITFAAPAAPAVTTIYNWSAVAAEKVGVTTLGANGVEESTVKIHTNSVTVNGIKVGSSYVYADGKWVAIKPAEGGFKAGDVLSVAAVFNNSDDTKYAQVDVYAADGATRLFRSDSASTINGRTKAGDPIVQTYTLASNQDSLFFGRYGNTTMYITLLKVERSAAAETLTAPEAAPAAPEYPANQVKAVYSATYNADCGYGEWGSGTVYTQEEFGKKFVTTNLGYFGLTFEGDAALNCSAMEKLHLDVWIANDASLRVVPIHGGAEVGVTKNLVGQQWNSIEIALSEFEGVTDWSNVYQIKIDNAREITFWVNNIYFYTTVAPAVDETAPADVTAIAQNPSYFSVEIKANATDASGAILYSVLQGELIVATGHAASGADAVITVAGLTPATEYNFSVIAKDESANAAEPVAVTATTIAAPAAAPAPAIQAPLVKSIYSDAYTRVPAEVDTYNAAWWEPTVQTEGLIATGDHALFYAAKGTGMCGWQFSEFNATGYPYLHLDIYPLAAGTIDIYPVCKDIADGPYHKTTPALVANQWNHVVLDYSALDISKIFQIGWINYYALNGYFIDNVFFSSRAEATAAPEADRRIYAYGLNVERDGDNYTFTFNANIAPAEANFIFYNEGVEIGSVAIANPVAGLNTKVLAINEIPEGENLTWAVELKAAPVYSFNKLAEGESLMKCHLAIDNSPESDYFGRMYVANRAGSGAGGIYVYNQDYTVHTANTLAGQPKWQSMGRPSVAVDGTVYIGDWGDGHGGVYVMDPATLTATCLFQGTQASNGLWTNAEGTAMGSSTAAVGVYGEGANTVLYAMNEDASTAGATLYAHGVNVYQLGQSDGSVLNTWNVAPTMTFALLDNAAQMFVINPTSKGAFFSCSRAKPNNASGARSLQFYNTNGERTYVALPEGETADLTGSLGGGCAVSRDEDILAIVDGDGNILVYDVTWNDATPALTKSTKYNTEFAALGSLCFDYAGNIVVTAGANYNNSTANKLVAYGVPTDENEIIVPAKKALVVTGTGTGTAIDNSFVAPKIEKIIRNGQVYIVRDGVVYTVTGTRVQ